MVRNNPQTLRLFFILVILGGLSGWWYASIFWQVDPAVLMADAAPDGEGDWVELLASFADQLLQLFLNLASPEN